MSLGDHLEELRSRLILIFAGVLLGLIVCLFFGKFFIDILTIPFEKALGVEDVANQLQALKPAETFLVYIKVCMFFGLLAVSPWVFWHIFDYFLRHINL